MPRGTLGGAGPWEGPGPARETNERRWPGPARPPEGAAAAAMVRPGAAGEGPRHGGDASGALSGCDDTRCAVDTDGYVLLCVVFFFSSSPLICLTTPSPGCSRTVFQPSTAASRYPCLPDLMTGQMWRKAGRVCACFILTNKLLEECLWIVSSIAAFGQDSGNIENTVTECWAAWVGLWGRRRGHVPLHCSVIKSVYQVSRGLWVLEWESLHL